MSDELPCVCGHELFAHHVSWFVQSGERLVEECEHDDEQDIPWTDARRCMHYRPVTQRVTGGSDE